MRWRHQMLKRVLGGRLLHKVKRHYRFVIDYSEPEKIKTVSQRAMLEVAATGME